MTSCVDTLGPGNLLCNSDHCNSFQETSVFHATCMCVDWQGHTIPDCNPKNSNYPVQTGQCRNSATGEVQNVTSKDCSAKGSPWFWETCYCCCTCFASNTPLAVPEGTRAIGDIVVGDMVMAGSGTNGGWTWTPQSVAFSSGSPPVTSEDPDAGNVMIFMSFGDNQALIVSRDQLFVMADGKLKRADQLVPGTDQLVGADGGTLPVNLLATGHYKGAIHHIATTVPLYDDWDGSIDNHLINANGVIGGDYLLQMYQDMPKMQPHLSAQGAPEMGSADYQASATGVRIKPFVVGAEFAAAGTEVAAENFRAHVESAAIIPPGAFQLFSDHQEALLFGPTIPKRGFSDVTNVQLTNYYAKLFGAIYPAVSVYLDWESIRPNVFAFSQYGKQTVVVGGELLRLGPLYGPAIAMATSFGVASAVVDSNSTDIGHSIYDGIGVVMQQTFQGGNTLNDLLTAGQAQLDALLTLLAAQEDGSSTSGLGASCISDTIDAAISGDPLPQCAGGPAQATLKVVGAAWDSGMLTITYSQPVDAGTALDPANYHLTPNGTLGEFTMAAGVSAAVRAEVNPSPGAYSLTVSRIVAEDGSALDPAHSSAAFAVTGAQPQPQPQPSPSAGPQA